MKKPLKIITISGTTAMYTLGRAGLEIPEIPPNYTGIVQYNDNNGINSTEYYRNGKRHRDDGPAVIWYTDDLFKQGCYNEYWLNNIKYNARDYWTRLYKLHKITKEDLFLNLL